MMCVVTKAFRVGEETLQPGTLVDASKWRNTASLISLRFLSPQDTTKDSQPATKGKAVKE